MRTLRAVAAVALLVLPALFAAIARPALAAPPDCTSCHKDDAADPKARFPLAEYRAGVHGPVDCVLCHRRPDGAFDQVPHTKTEPDIDGCIACHGLQKRELKAEHKRGVHGEMACSECHDRHTMVAVRPTTETAVRRERANGPCIRCHADAALPGGTKAHQWLPNREQHANMRCIVCHAKLEAEHDHEIVPKGEATRDCAACHKSDGVLVQKYIGTDDRSAWVTNPILFQKAYVAGATRNRLMDRIILGIFVGTILGTLGHGFLRMLAKSRRKEEPYEVATVDLYPASLRVWHWTNAFLMLGLALTGLKIHFGAREREILTFEEAFNIHNLLGVALLPVTAWFFLRAFATGDFRQYVGKPEDGVRGILRQVRYYLVGVFRGEDHPYHSRPERRFNPLQQVTYASIMYTLVPTIAVSGALLLYPEVLPEKLAGRTGAFWVSLLHYVSGCGAIAFLLGHLYLATTGDRVTYNFTAMWNGRHRHHVRKGGHGAVHGDAAGSGPPATNS